MKIHLPNSAWLGNIDPFLRSFVGENPSSLEISSHPEWISVHPVVLSMVAALGLECKSENIKFEKLTAKSKHYLERMGLFDLWKIESGINVEEHESAGRFIPLTVVKSSDELTKFLEDMIPLLHLKPEQVRPIRYIVSELARNVLEHSESKIGAILCAQYYFKSNTMRIGIVDRGVGIKSTISKFYPIKDDLEAIRLALTPGVTGTTRKIGGTEQNAGAGLFFIKSIAKVNRDFFMIYSGNGLYKLLKTKSSKAVRLQVDPFRDNSSKSNGFPYWKGTVVGVDLSLDSKEEFNELLKLISSTYSKKVKEEKKKYYKRKARFI
jgi:anti-sigma regulatory factor (Ser/Thr protein kinase)